MSRPRWLTSLVTSGITIAPITLHAGVTSAEAGEPPVAELFDVPLTTARLVNLTHATGGGVVAVGTSATRALESDAWTDLVLGPDRPVRVVDGLITGWHDAAPRTC